MSEHWKHDLTRWIGTHLSVPWSAFVASFLYYTLLTATILAGGSFEWPVLVGAYLLPAAAYVLTLTRRLALTIARTGRRAVMIRHGGYAVPSWHAPAA